MRGAAAGEPVERPPVSARAEAARHNATAPDLRSPPNDRPMARERPPGAGGSASAAAAGTGIRALRPRRGCRGIRTGERVSPAGTDPRRRAVASPCWRPNTTRNGSARRRRRRSVRATAFRRLRSTVGSPRLHQEGPPRLYRGGAPEDAFDKPKPRLAPAGPHLLVLIIGVVGGLAALGWSQRAMLTISWLRSNPTNRRR